MMRSLPRAVGLLLAVGCVATDAKDAQESPRAPQGAGSYAAGQLIVKLKPEAGAALDAMLAQGRAPTQSGMAWFDALSVRYGLSRIEPVLAGQQDVESIRRKYPQRARRAPPGTSRLQPLRYLYKLTLRPDVDLRHAAAAYSAHPAVEYAEPNYLATIQGSSPH